MALSSERKGFMGALQRMRGSAEDPNKDQDIADALGRVSKTPDGQIIFDWLQRETFGRTLSEDASEGALRAAEARKSFATKIFNLRDRGLKRDATGQ